MTDDEAVAAIARDTGWQLEYILGLTEYWKKIMLGWKPRKKLTEEEVDRRNRAMSARLRAMMEAQKRPQPPKRAQHG